MNTRPDNIDFANPTQFRFVIDKLPNTEFFIPSANVPSISSTSAEQNTPFKSVPHADNVLDYESLELTFLLNEDYSNYTEVYNWMVGLGFPDNYDQSERSVSDATLIILSNKNNPIAQFNFKDTFPVTLGSIEYNVQEEDSTQIEVSITLDYTIFEFEKL